MYSLSMNTSVHAVSTKLVNRLYESVITSRRIEGFVAWGLVSHCGLVGSVRFDLTCSMTWLFRGKLTLNFKNNLET